MASPTVGDIAPDFTLDGTNGAFRLASSDSIELCLDVRADRRQHKLRVDSSNRLGAISMQLRGN